MESPDERWQRWYEELLAYKAVHGHARVPWNHVTTDGRKLGLWLSNQRRSDRIDLLRLDRARALEEAGVDLGSAEARRARWQRSYEALLAYKDAHGHVDAPYEHATADGLHLGHWLHTQIDARSRGLLPQEHARLLEDAGADVLGARNRVHSARHRAHLEVLTAYKAEHGHPNVPQSYEAAGLKAGWWLTAARQARRTQSILPALEQALDELGVDWEPPPGPRPVARCGVPGCVDSDRDHGLCTMHRERLTAHGSPVPVKVPAGVCLVRGCGRTPGEEGWCRGHQRAVDAGHGRSAYRRRNHTCGGRCEVCRADHIRERQEGRRRAAETEFPSPLQIHFIGRLWEGAPLDEACTEIGLTPGRLWTLSRASLPELGAAADAALMARRDPDLKHGRESTYMVHRCRCPECRAAKGRYR